MQFTLCTSLCALHSMHFTLCTSLYALHSMHFTLCTSLYALHSMRFTLCTSLCALASMHFTLCTLLYALHSMHFALCTSLYALRSMHFTLCTSLYALHSMHFTLCTSLYALHSMHFTLCTSVYVVVSGGSARKNPSRCFREKHPRVFTRAEVRYRAICGVFKRPDVRYHAILRCFQTPGASAAYYICTTKSRLSSHGSSARKLRASPTYYICTTKVDYPATEAPGVRGVLRLYYKTRLSSHGSSACPYYKSRLWHRDHAETRRGVTFVCQKTQKHDGFGTAPTPKPAEGLRSYVKKRKNTMVLAPRQRRNPQRGYVCMSKNAKTRWFWHRANAETRRGVTFVCQKRQKHDGFGTAPTPKPAEGCLRPRKKVPKTTVLAPRPGDYPQRVVRGQKETSKKRRFWHCDHAETRRGLSADTKKRKKNDGFSTTTTPKPAEGCNPDWRCQPSPPP